EMGIQQSKFLAKAFAKFNNNTLDTRIKDESLDAAAKDSPQITLQNVIVSESLKSTKITTKIASPSQSAAASEPPQSLTPISSETVGTSGKKLVRPAFVNALEAKQWNPNNPASWDAEMREYHTLAESDYVLPTDAKEQDRLEMQHYVHRAAFNGDIISPAAKKLVSSAGVKVLDVGCANGFWLQCVAKANPLPEYHGVDISESLIGAPPSENGGIQLVFGNVLEDPDNTFDYVHQRLLVLGMPREKFPNALRELIRVTKPGGWIELVEADIVCYNAGPYNKTSGTALFDAMHRRGLDTYAATNLPWYVKQVADSVENQENILVRLPMGSWGPQIGILNAGSSKAGMLAMEDWMHKSMGITREEYRDLAQNCYQEWTENKCFQQCRAVYFQVKK
ncbi:hypothetical protein HK100_004423, partial [Physocladia obscura]